MRTFLIFYLTCAHKSNKRHLSDGERPPRRLNQRTKRCKTMTKSELFKAAHKIARETKAIAGSYRIAFSCALRDLYAGVANMNEKSSKEKEAAEEIQVIIYAGGSYVNKRVASLEEAAALRAEYRSKTPEFSRFSFKCFDPEKVQFDQFGRIIAGGYTV